MDSGLRKLKYIEMTFLRLLNVSKILSALEEFVIPVTVLSLKKRLKRITEEILSVLEFRILLQFYS